MAKRIEPGSVCHLDGLPATGRVDGKLACSMHVRRFQRNGSFRARAYGVPTRASCNATQAKNLGALVKAGSKGMPADGVTYQTRAALLRRGWAVLIAAPKGDRLRATKEGLSERARILKKEAARARKKAGK